MYVTRFSPSLCVSAILAVTPATPHLRVDRIRQRRILIALQCK